MELPFLVSVGEERAVVVWRPRGVPGPAGRSGTVVVAEFAVIGGEVRADVVGAVKVAECAAGVVGDMDVKRMKTSGNGASALLKSRKVKWTMSDLDMRCPPSRSLNSTSPKRLQPSSNSLANSLSKPSIAIHLKYNAS